MTGPPAPRRPGTAAGAGAGAGVAAGSAERGLIPRMLEHVFACQAASPPGFQFEVRAGLPVFMSVSVHVPL